MFKLVPISDVAMHKATLARWKVEAMAMGDEGVFLAGDVERRLRWLQEQDKKDENIHGYFGVKTGDACASSILELSHAMPRTKGAWLKLLDITLRPELQPSGDKTSDSLKETFLILAYSINRAITLIFTEHPSKKLKIYGRTNGMRSLFKAMMSVGKLDSALKKMGLSINLESNWLVITRAGGAR